MLWLMLWLVIAYMNIIVSEIFFKFNNYLFSTGTATTKN